VAPNSKVRCAIAGGGIVKLSAGVVLPIVSSTPAEVSPSLR